MAAEEEHVQEIRKFLKEKAPQVKSFEWDRLFTGGITCYERKDLGPKGYKTMEKKFKNLKELKEYYAEPKIEKRVKDPDENPRGRSKGSSNRVTGKVGNSESKERDSG